MLSGWYRAIASRTNGQNALPGSIATSTYHCLSLGTEPRSVAEHRDVGAVRQRQHHRTGSTGSGVARTVLETRERAGGCRAPGTSRAARRAPTARPGRRPTGSRGALIGRVVPAGCEEHAERFPFAG